MEYNDTIKLLKECDSGTKMAVTSIDEVMDKVQSVHMKQLLHESRDHHEQLGNEIHSLLIEHGRGKRLYLLILVWVFVSGALDELHQLFVPDRWCSFADVCLDTCGGAFGLLLCVAVSRLRIRKGYKQEIQSAKNDMKSNKSGKRKRRYEKPE